MIVNNPIEEAFYDTLNSMASKIPSDDTLQKKYPLQYMSHEQIYTACDTLTSLIFELKHELSTTEYIKLNQMIWSLYAYSFEQRNKEKSTSFQNFYEKWTQ